MGRKNKHLRSNRTLIQYSTHNSPFRSTKVGSVAQSSPCRLHFLNPHIFPLLLHLPPPPLSPPPPPLLLLFFRLFGNPICEVPSDGLWFWHHSWWFPRHPVLATQQASACSHTTYPYNLFWHFFCIRTHTLIIMTNTPSMLHFLWKTSLTLFRSPSLISDYNQESLWTNNIRYSKSIKVSYGCKCYITSRLLPL